jgi:hypothetical protein
MTHFRQAIWYSPASKKYYIVSMETSLINITSIILTSCQQKTFSMNNLFRRWQTQP